MSRRVVVTGLGVICPVGNSTDEAWNNLVKGKSGIDRITLFDASELETQFAGEVKGFDPEAIFGRKEARRMDRYTQLGMEASRQAVEDSGILNSGFEPDRIGVFMGSGVGGMSTLLEQHDVYKERGPRRLSPFFIPMMLPDSGAGAVAIAYGFRGPNLAIITACATGANLIGEACETIRRGAADAMLAGGTEAGIIDLAVAGFNVMRAISTRNDNPQAASRPFDADRDGFVMAEGAAIFFLEELEHARARNARIYAEMLGYGTTADAFHMVAPHDEGLGARKAMEVAIQSAGLTVDDIDYINAHGTSTPLNDPLETKSIKAVFGEKAYRVPISSTKSMTGHLLGAAGSLEAFACVKVINEGIIPPTINLEKPDPECDLDYVPNVARKAEVNFALSNSFGFGGHNACLILGRLKEEKG